MFPDDVAGTSFDAIKSFVRFTADRPGTLDLVFQFLNILNTNGPFSELVALSPQIQANTRYRSPCTAVTDPGWGDSSVCAVQGLPGELAVSSQPGGDFDWQVQLETAIHIDWASTRASALMDLSHTAVVRHAAPADAVTLSGNRRRLPRPARG